MRLSLFNTVWQESVTELPARAVSLLEKALEHHEEHLKVSSAGNMTLNPSMKIVQLLIDTDVNGSDDVTGIDLKSPPWVALFH